MKRLLLAFTALVALVGIAFATVDVRSDVAALFGEHQVTTGALDTPSDRLTILALSAADPEPRERATDAVAAMLLAEPAVEAVMTGPVAPSRGFLDWLWQHRFQLMPPAPEDLEPAAMAEELEEARLMLAGAESLAVADKLLTDPTGSFARLLAAVSTTAARLDQENGLWVSKGRDATLLFITLADQPFDAAEISGLADRIRGAAVDAGANADLLGPRIISAEVSQFTARGSMWSGGIASALLLLTLAWLLRSGPAVGAVLLPVAIGVAVAVLAVQAIFGSVHAVALGFGGALCGLGLDYPLHLSARRGEARKQAARLVLIGALTTSVGFLALIGSGVEALVQTGVFVATGLSVAAITAQLLAVQHPHPARSIPAQSLIPKWRHRRVLECALIAAGVVAVLTAPAARPQTLFPLPEHLSAAIDRIAGMIDLPSGRYGIEVEGSSLTSLLEQQRALASELDGAKADGVISGYEMLATVFAIPPALDSLPAPDAFQAAAVAALDRAGMKPAFAERQTAAYRVALDAPPMSLDALDAHAELRALSAGIEATEGTLREAVRLYGVSDAGALKRIAEQAGARFVDRAAPVEAGLSDLRRTLILWFAIGGAASIALLTLALRDFRRTAGIALTCAAALSTTVGLSTLLLGPIDMFQIIALTLVTGIGIDYGLFLTHQDDGETGHPAAHSVALCAASTLIAFGVMALSSVELLQQIGLTVSLGVMTMLALNLIQPPETDRALP
ncbi:MAG: MMPL family transporter [Pseudomonadota bacterium]